MFEKYAVLQEKLEKSEGDVAQLERSQEAIANPEDFLDDLNALENLLEEQRILVGDIAITKPSVDESCADANSFLEENSESIVPEKVKALSDLSTLVQQRIDELASIAAKKLQNLEDAHAKAKESKVIQGALQSETVSEIVDEFDEEETKTLEDLIEMGIVHPTDMLELLQADGYFKGIIDMRTGKNVAISAAALKGLITKTTVLQVLGTDAQIKGVVDVTTGDTLSVGMATRHGIIDRQTGMRILERQVASGGLLKPPSLNGCARYGGSSLDKIVEIDNEEEEEKLKIRDAIKIGIIDPVLGQKLLKTEKARGFNLDSEDTQFFSEDDDVQGRDRVVEKIVIDQLCALGGVLDPRTKEILPLPLAMSRGLVSQELGSKLMERQMPVAKTYFAEQQAMPKYSSSLDSITEDEEFVSSSESSESDEPSRPDHFDVNLARIRARRMREMRESHFRHRRMSTIYEEDEEDALDQTTGESLTLGALSRRAAVELNSGSRVLEGLDPAGRILIHHTPEGAGPGQGEEQISLHIVDAFARGLLSEPVAFRLLEAHLAQGGIPDPTTGERVSPEEALRRGYITEEMAEKLIVALKKLLQERAQMYVFRINELLSWCASMESEIHECDFLKELERSVMLEKMLQNAVPELRAISDTLEEVENFINRDRGHLDPFSVNELIVLSTELQENAQSIERSLRDDHAVVITTRRPLIGRCETPMSPAGSSVTSDGFALDEEIANNLARLQELDEEADAINEKLRELSEDELDFAGAKAEDLTLDAMQRQLDELKSINAQVSATTPDVISATACANSFVDQNDERLQPDLAEELKTASCSLDRKWEIIQEAAAEKMKQQEDDLRLLQEAKQRKATVDALIAELDPLLDHVREWVAQSRAKLNKERPASIDEKEMLAQYNTVEEHHKFISTPQDKIANILQRYRDFLKYPDVVALVLAGDVVPIREKEVDELEKERHALLQDTQERMKRITQTKDELSQFRQLYTPYRKWLDDASQRCGTEKQLPSDIPALEDESRDIGNLQTEISSHKADLRFLRMTSKRLVDAAKAYNSTLSLHADETSGDVISDPTEREVENLMSETESFYENVAKQAQEREALLADVLKKRAAYEASLPNVYPWLDQTEKQLESINKRPLPVEPNALQVQTREIEHVMQDITGHNPSVQRVEDTANDVTSLPLEAIEDPERTEIQNLAESTRKRYEGLRSAAAGKSSELNSALSKSQGVSERLESLLNWLDNLEKQLEQNKSETVAQLPKVMAKLEDANAIKASVDLRSPEVTEVKTACSALLGGGDGQTTDSLQKRMSQLNARFGQVGHETAQRCIDLEELRKSLEDFELNNAKISEWIENSHEKLNDDDISGANEAELQAVEDRIKDLRAEVEAKRPAVEQTLKNAENIIGDCRVTDASPTRDAMSRLSNSWEELLEILTEMEEELVAKRAQMTAFETSMTDITSWMKSVDDAVGNMADSVVINTLDEQISKTQELLDSWEEKAKVLDRVYELSAFDSKSTMSPSRRRSRTHKRKKGMRKSRARLSQKENIAASGNKGESESQLEDINTMFEDLSDKIFDKQTALTQIRETREAFDKQEGDFDQLLDSAEVQKKEWQEALKASEQGDVNEMKNKLAQHKVWRENLLSHTNELQNATSTSTKLCEPKPRAEGVPAVQEQINDINKRWTNLLSASDEYVSDLENSFGALGDFNTRAAQLKDWLADKRNMLNMLGAVVCDRTVLPTQAQQVEHLSKDVDSKKPHVDSLTAVAKTLPNAEEAQQEISAIEGQWAELNNDLGNRKSTIENLLARVNELERLSKEVCDWSEELSSAINGRKEKLDTNLECLRQEEAGIPKIRESQVEPNEAKVARCQQCVSEMLSEASDESSSRMAHIKLDLAENALTSAKKGIDSFERVLREAQEKSESLEKSATELSTWIVNGHRTVKECVPVLAEDDLLETQEILRELLKNAENKKETDLEDIKKLAEALKSLCPADSEVTETKKSRIKTDLERLIEAISRADQDVLDLLQRLHEFENLAAELGDKIVDGENELKAHKIIPHEARTDRHVEALKMLQAELASLASQVVYLEDFASDLMRESPDTDDEASQRVKQSAADINERFRALKQALDAECGKLADTVQQTEKIQEQVRDLMSRLNDLEEECDSCSPIAREEAALDSQRDEIVILNETHHQIHAEIAKVHADYKIMVTNGDIMDDYNLQREVEMILKKDQRLNARIQQRADEIARILEQVRTFVNNADKAKTNIAELLETEANLGEVASTVDEILKQQKQFEELRHKSYEPLQASVQKLHYGGHALVISATPTVKTNHITETLDELEQLWNELTSNMNARSLNLQKALLSCGRFQDVYASLSSWLSDAEQLAESQKSPSWEYKVLLAQLEEQKVLQRMVASHQEAVSSFLRDGAQLASGASPANKETINKQLKAFQERWEALCAKVKSRDTQLKSMIGDAKRFHELVEGFTEWLEETERCHANNDAIGTRVERIQEQLTAQQTLLDDIKKHQLKLTDIVDAPLLPKTSENSPELVQGLQTKIDGVRKRYNALKQRVESRMSILRENLHLCRLFNEDHLRLFAFLSEAELRLQDGQSTLTDARPPPVEEVWNEVKEIHDQIIAKRATVDAAMREGKELMMKCTGEDTIQVQEKLESIKGKYVDLQAKSADRVETLGKCLKTSEEMQRAHLALTQWLDANETALRKLGLDVADVNNARPTVLGEDLKELNDLVESIHADEYEPELKSIKKCAKELSRVASRWGDEPLQSVVVDDESRFKALKIALQRHQTSKKMNEDKLETKTRSLDTPAKGFGDCLVILPQNTVPMAKYRKKIYQNLPDSDDEDAPLTDAQQWSKLKLQEEKGKSRSKFHAHSDQPQTRRRRRSSLWGTPAAGTSSEQQRELEFFDHANACQKDLDDLASRLSDMTITSLEPEYLKHLSHDMKQINDDVGSGRNRVHSISDEGDSLAPLCDDDDKEKIKKHVNALECTLADISQQYQASQIERSLPLASAYVEAKEDLLPWLEETKSAVESFKPPAILGEELEAQQKEAKALRDDVAEHRPYVDKLNKIGAQLAQLIVVDNPSLAAEVVQSTDDVNKAYASIREAVRGRTVELENALGESNQFFERLTSLMDKLANDKKAITTLPPVIIEWDKIKERIGKIKLQEVEMGKLLPTYNSIKTQGEKLLNRSDASAVDTSKQMVQERLIAVTAAWKDLSDLIEALLVELNDLLAACKRYWNDAESLHTLLRELDTMIAQEVGEPSVDLVGIKQQIEVLETLCEEMANLEKDLEAVRLEASELCSSEDSPRHPGDFPNTMEVKKVADELTATWAKLQDNVAKTRSKLDEAMNEAVEFQESVQGMLDLLKEAHDKVENLSPVAPELDTVKSQVEELKGLRTQTHAHQIELERLCNQGDLMASQAKSDSEKANMKHSVAQMRQAWKELNSKILARQHDLETAMLALGQLHHAINELAGWLNKTEQELDSERPLSADNPKQVEIELAKHKILWNDILAHKVTLDSITAAAHELSATVADDGSTPTKKDGVEVKMDELNAQWEEVNAKAQARQWELEECFEKAQGRQRELDLLCRWLQDKDYELNQNAPYGGLPETALGQLNTHKILMGELDKKKEVAAQFLSPETGTSQVEAGLFEEKLKIVEAKMEQRKAKLEEVLEQAQNFHDNLQAFMQWLADSEKSLDSAQPPSIVMETVESQLHTQKAFEEDVHLHRDILLELDNAGSHLKYFSQKQDGILIKNLLLSVHARWDKITSRASERARLLNDCHKKAKQFYDSWQKLCDWLDSAKQNLEENYAPASDPDKIKALLGEHKEFQRAVASKRPVYDATTRSGKALREKGHTYGDKSHVDEKLRQLKEKWDSMCGKSSERQSTLEEALMVSGRLIDTIDAMLDWLYKVEPFVAADSPVHGDVHTVANLIDQHNDLLTDINNRDAVVQSLQKSSAEMAESADSSWVKGQMQELSMRWDALCKFAKVKEARLGSAKAQAEEFQVSAQDIIEWLAASEKNLRLNQQLPADEFQLQELKAANHEFMAESEKKNNDLERALQLGSSILEQAHPEAITPLKHWITVLQSRWEEVLTWAKQHGERIDAAINDMEAKAALHEKLMKWLKDAEDNLDMKNDQPMPETLDAIETLIAEHQEFQDEMLKLQPEYDQLTRTVKRRATRPDVLKKRKSTDILQEEETAGTQLQNKWQRVWLKALDRQQRLQHAHAAAKQLASMDDFSFDKWRSRYMRWMKNKKSRVMDFFRRIDTDGDGKITRKEFIDGIIKSRFPTTEVEMERVADIFDQDKDGYIDYYEFVAALHPNKEAYKPATDADKIEDEVVRQVAKCTCSKRFQVQQISENKYRSENFQFGSWLEEVTRDRESPPPHRKFFMGSQFGDNQQLRLVRILRSTVMVRVGGGWMSLDEFLVKNDPCRAKGRTNTELREKFILPAGATQQMAAFRTKRGGTPSRSSLQRSLPTSRGTSRNTSPSRSGTPDSHCSHPHKRNGHESGKTKSNRSRHSSGSSEHSSTPSLSSSVAAARDLSPSRVGANSPAHPSPSRFSTPTMSSTPKVTSSLSRASTSDTPRRSKIPTKGAQARKNL